MKRIVAIVLCIILAFSTVNLTVFAKDSNPIEQKVNFTVSSSFGMNGDTTKVFVDISEDSMMSAAVFKLKFDKDFLNATNAEVGIVLKDGYTSKNILNDGEILVSYAHTSPIYEGGRLFEVEFDIVGDVPSGCSFIEIPLELEVVELKGFDYTNLTASVDNGEIVIVDSAYGDANLDELVAPSDTLLILNYAVNLVELNDEQKLNSDVNGDGKINSIDAMFILRYTAGVISTYPVFELQAPPELRVSEKDETFIKLEWDNVEFATGYNIYMNGVQVNQDLITNTYLTVESLEQDTKYSFCVTSNNVLKESTKSDVLEISTNKADRYVSFVDYDGTVIQNQIVLSGTDAVEPTTPKRTGYTFTGWDKSLKNITADTVITAQYKINNYTVSFNTGDGSAVESQSVQYGSYAKKPTTPTKNDYTFMGWFTDSAYVNKWDFNSNKVERDIVLYAKWETWSSWTTDASLSSNSNYEVQSKTQYSYRDKSTTTSTASSLSGWTQSGSYVTYGSWQNVGWTKSKPSESSTLQITNTKTVTDSAAYTNYNYYYYRYWYSAVGKYYYTYHGDYGGTYKTYTTTSPLPYNQTASGRDMYGPTNIYYNYELWFLRSTEYVPAVTHTEWYYQTRTATTNYNYYKWSSWSNWNDSSVSSASNREIKTRTVYRYKPIQE